MDSTDKHRSISVAVTVASDIEPVRCEGILTRNDGGFVLEFSIRQDKFIIDHNSERTRISVCGGMSYDICLSDEQSSTLLGTPYGKIRFDVLTIERDVKDYGHGVRILLRYILKSSESGEIERAVDISARV